MNDHLAPVPFLRTQLAGVFGAVMHDDHSVRRIPSLQLPEPLPHHSRRTDNDAGLEQATAVQACQEGCQLDGFAQAHLIPNDASCSLCMQLPQPFHAWRKKQQPMWVRLVCLQAALLSRAPHSLLKRKKNKSLCLSLIMTGAS